MGVECICASVCACVFMHASNTCLTVTIFRPYAFTVYSVKCISCECITTVFLCSILNKLTPENFDRLTASLLRPDGGINDKETLKGAIILVRLTHTYIHTLTHTHTHTHSHIHTHTYTHSQKQKNPRYLIRLWTNLVIVLHMHNSVSG